MNRRDEVTARGSQGRPLSTESSGGENRGERLVELVTSASRCLSDSFRSFNDRTGYQPLTDVGAPSEPGANDEEAADRNTRLYKIVDSNGKSLIESVRGGRCDDLKWVEEAFITAGKKKHLLNLHNDNDDILRAAIEERNYEATRLILENLANKCTSVEETARILTDNILDLEKHFPDLLMEFIVKDKFCFELCRFSVPSNLFNSKDSTIVATSDAFPRTWTPSEAEARHLWTDMHPQTSEADEVNSQGTVLATLSVVPIEDIAKSAMSRMPESLLVSRVPVEVFKSKLIRWVMDWKWRKVYRPLLWMLFLLDVILVGCFSAFVLRDKGRLRTFSWQHSYVDEHGTEVVEVVEHRHEAFPAPSSIERDLLSISFFICLFFFVQELLLLIKCVRHHGFRGVMYFLSSPWNWAKVVSGLFMIVLFALVLDEEGQRNINRDAYDRLRETTVAVECILLWATVLYYAQPFTYTGPLVAIVQAVLLDIIPFMALGIVVLLGFSLASFSLNNQGYRSLPWTIQALFYALLGEFDYYADEGEGWTYFRTWCYFLNQTRGNGWPQPTACNEHGLDADVENEEDEDESVARHVFLDIYVLLEGIVLLTLLYTIMSDTHDRVKMNAEAELTRFRAMIVDDCESMLFKFLREFVERKTKRYLYVLRPADKNCILYGAMNWKGKLKKTEKITKALLQETKSELLSRLKRLEAQQSRLERVETKLEELTQRQETATESQRQMLAMVGEVHDAVLQLESIENKDKD